MAATIVSTPALGASDWSGWITQQGLTDRGFMRLSLTNFAGTATSTVAAGSILECAGSIYSFTDTAITLAAATASAAVAVYFVAIPSAGGTTCTVVMDSTAPVWVDAKQGFYASAASVSRAFGGCYIGTALTYYTKFLYTGENLVYCLQTGNTRPLLKRMLNIGEWNMDVFGNATINHGLGPHWNAIRSIAITIRDDNGTAYYHVAPESMVGSSISSYFNAGNINLERVSGGTFDSATFNGTASTVANRGWVLIEIEA